MAQVFSSLLRESEQGVLVLSFNCQKNLPIPKFLIRKLTTNNNGGNASMLASAGAKELRGSALFSLCEKEFRKSEVIVDSQTYINIILGFSTIRQVGIDFDIFN
ncbi:hypothetical protein PR048_017042 [Dryococelus australis]|uniref:Uncharacterized protein n=1 Tax=Dryococelus australis TaxID=614101 RepID=A0ABQ9H8G5_9NEOP|nr:hypothetical protein PR048_017042 [Dryococelus australis]